MTDSTSSALPDTTLPRPEECFLCFTDRMLSASGCDTTLRWVRRWRDLRAPSATTLERRLGGHGGFCDCEVLINGFAVRDDLLVLDEYGELDEPAELPPCAGARAGSTQPCTTWVPRRGRW